MCVQVIPAVNLPAGGENCLFLNTYTPDPQPEEPAPVMVHFGGVTDGSTLVRRRDVVVVSFNYCLAGFGFSAYFNRLSTVSSLGPPSAYRAGRRLVSGREFLRRGSPQ